MSEGAAQIEAASGVIRALQTLNRLTLEATEAASKQELVFHILNNTVSLVGYDRAVLWRFRKKRPQLLGVSGQAQVDAHAPLTDAWRDLLSHLREIDAPGVLSAERFPGREDAWQRQVERMEGGSVLWVPLPVDGRSSAGLWLERWSGKTWQGEERDLLVSLARGYAAAWRQWERRLPFKGDGISARRLWILGAVAALLACLLFLVPVLPVRLRVVAPCQVVAKEPAVVAAPLQGVIDRIVVDPGSRVQPGDLLFRYDRRVADKELTIVRQQLAVREAQLTQARMRAFHDADVRAGLPSLEARVSQDRVRLQLADSQAEQLEVRAERAGIVRIEEPHAWQGRAVDVGERVLMIVDPDRTMARIWVPEGDMIRYAPDEPARVVLNVRPGDALAARITYASSHVRPSPKGVHGFVVEADWADGAPSVRLGLEGTAVLYGSEKVCLAYWLLRKPLAAVRRWFGV